MGVGRTGLQTGLLPGGPNFPRGLIGFLKLESTTLAEVGPALLADVIMH